MAQLDVRRTFADDRGLFEEDLTNIVEDIETFLNVTKLNNDNFQDAGISASTKVADGAITATTIANDAITTAKILDGAVSTSKFAAGAVTAAKIAAANVTTAKIADSAVTTAKIADGAIESGDIAANAVEYAKQAATNYSISSSSGVVSISSSQDVASVSLTTTGRPVFIGLISDGSGSPSYWGLDFNGAGATGVYMRATMLIKRGASTIAAPCVQSYVSPTNVYVHAPVGTVIDTATNTHGYYLVPPGAAWCIDQPSAGTYTYTVTLVASYSTSAYSGHASGSPAHAECRYAKLVAFEM